MIKFFDFLLKSAGLRKAGRSHLVNEEATTTFLKTLEETDFWSA